MWFRLEKIIKEKEKEKDGVEKIKEDSFKKEEKAVLSKMNEILQKEE